MSWLWRRDLAVARTRVAADHPLQFPSRITAAEGVTGYIARVLPVQEPLAAAESLSEMAERLSGDDAARLVGLAHFAARQSDAAAAAFESIRNKTAGDWNDLAAAEIARNDEGAERWIRALVAVDRAISLDGNRLEPKYNRALVLDHFGVTRLQRTHWPAGGDPRWEAEAKRRAQTAAAAAAPRATKTILQAPLEQTEALARQYPADARAVGETQFLSAWAAAKTPDEAKLHLDRARAIGSVLERDFGESMLANAVAAIDRAGPHGVRLRAGHLAYDAGRRALDPAEENAVEAEHKLREAQRELSAGGSPMEAMADSYLATIYVNQTRTAEAVDLLARLRARVRPGQKALLARIQHDVSLCEAQRGRWSASLHAANEAVAILTALRDRTSAAISAATAAEDYDYLGQRELAWKHALPALRDACTAQHPRNARATLAALTRTEMRAERWEAARSLARIEEALASIGKKARPDTVLRLRVAAIELHLGNVREAEQAVADARKEAARVPHPRVRLKLLADVEGAAGAITRKRDPAAAVALLSRAIAYQQQSDRKFVLPELYLERGRAHIALGAWAAAEQDLDKGIEELEHQRDHVDQAELRPGLFDSSAALFHEAVSLQLRRGGEPARVLGYIERGRARAMLEQLGESREPPALAEVQRNLDQGTALVEYMTLPDRLVIVAITRDRARVQTMAVPRTLPTDYADLYDLLIRPVSDVAGGARAITFVPDDALQRVPFAALFDRDTRSFLVQRHTVATAPSAGVAILTMRRQQHGKPTSALVFANPTIPRDTFPDLESLFASEYEARAVAKRYSRAEILKRDDATAERFLALAPDYEVVHFAGHAKVEHAEPGASALVCASSPALHGRLTLRQIAAMRFTRTQVVVLAACSTMRGRNAAIEGVPSLARAFVVAGVPAVVGTLWDIDDAEAAPLMRVLHEELAKGVAPADALRAAQLAAIRDGRPVEQWAAFAVTGVAR